MGFAERLRTERRRAGLSQDELGGDRCSTSFVSHLEKGRRVPTPELARFFESQLDLEPGTLTADLPRTRSGITQARYNAAAACAMYLEAESLWRNGVLGRAFEAAERLDFAVTTSQSDLYTLSRVLLASIQSDLGRYGEAVEILEPLRRSAARASSETLLLDLTVRLSRAHRLAGDRPSARAASQQALTIVRSETEAISPELEAEAFIAVLSTDDDHVMILEWEDRLSDLIERLEGSHTQGRVEWALGTSCLLNGDSETGRTWYDAALQHLSAGVSLRDWARFPRAAAEELLNHDDIEGARSFLTEAQQRLETFAGPDEVAALRLVEARYALAAGNEDEATFILLQALADEDISEATYADVLLEAARRFEGPQTRDFALRAAEIFTRLGLLSKAQDAWRVVPDSAESEQ